MAHNGLTTAYPSDPAGGAAELDRCLEGIAGRDPKALETLYRRTSAAVYAFALSILKNTHDAEDVLQDCYLKIYAGAAGYRSAGKPMAWILTIARNLCLQRLRERQRTSDLPQEDWEPWLASCQEISQEDRMVIRECMDRLSDQERQIVILHAVAGFRHREIASLLDLPLATVLSKYSRAVRKLKQAL
ncbi:MAG: RNA polymerase sigma factor [Oscillospiraceae bacterium]